MDHDNEIVDEAEQARLRKIEKKKRKKEERARQALLEANEQGGENGNEAETLSESAKKQEKAEFNENGDIRKKAKIEVEKTRIQSEGDDFGDFETFAEARKAFPKVSWKMFDAVTENFTTPTPIQGKTWGATLAGRDVIGIATTGSGKTLAFVLPMIAKIMANPRLSPKDMCAHPRALVLAPTRELCTQSFEIASKACDVAELKAAVTYGGASRSHQQKALQKGVDFLVATPGRLLDFLESGDVAFDACEFIVLDEADRMLDMGFEKDVRKVMKAATAKNRQILMFSATWPESIRSIAAEFLKPSAFKITLSGEKLQANARVNQQVEVMDPRNKDNRLLEILEANKNMRTIVFALYKKEAERVQQTLQRRGYKVAGVHGDKNQHEREAAVAAFARGDCLILVATDVASRGLDIKGVELVINYTFPLTVEDYVHRIGRTGRAGASGRSITFFTEHDKARAGELQNVLRDAGANVPDALAKFGSTVKKKEHGLYGAHFKKDADMANKSATMVTFDSDDE